MPISSLTEARDAIQAHFKTAWEAQSPPVPKVLYQDVKDEIPVGTDPWARITIIHNTSGQATVGGAVGNRRFRRFGLVTVEVYTPFGDGLTNNDIFAKVAVDAFEGTRTSGGDSVEFRNVRSNEIGPDGDWFHTNVIAEFEYDEVK